jgi:hypothetical protein
MPPDNADDAMTEEEIGALIRWIGAGAACP